MSTAPHGPRTDAQHQQRLQEILEDAGIVMLASRGASGELHCRPMAVARIEPDGAMAFATALDSSKIDELDADPQVDIIFQSRARFAQVAGIARVVRDRALIDELWSEAWTLWFPDGKHDPTIAIIVVEPTRGEYWDQSGARGLSFLYRAARAFATGEPIESRPQDHGKVQM